MDIILYFVDFFIHLDQYLPKIIEMFGVWAYVIVFIVIFCETGLVVTPVLPGDSLLFALGALAALGALHIEALLILLCIAAIAGDSVNYAIGHYIGPKVFHNEDGRFFRQVLYPIELMEHDCKSSTFIKLKQASGSALQAIKRRFVYKIIFCYNSPERIIECTIL